LGNQKWKNLKKIKLYFYLIKISLYVDFFEKTENFACDLGFLDEFLIKSRLKEN